MGRRAIPLALSSLAVLAPAACSLGSLDYLRDPRCAPDCGADALAPDARATDAADAGAPDAADAAEPAADACAAGGGYRAVVLCDHPLAYFRLGEKSAPTAFDEVDGGPLGSYVELGDGGLTYGVPGAIAGDPDTAIHFGGEAEVSAGPELAFPGTAPYSIEAWVTTDVLDAAYRRIAERAVPGSAGIQDGYVLYNQDPSGIGATRSVSGATSAVSGAELGTGAVFSHVVATYDGARLALYVNGAAGAPVDAPTALASVQASFLVGSSAGGGGGWIGSIDEVAVYGYALGPAQVTAHYRAGRGL